MISCDDTEWLLARLAATEAQIVAIENALITLSTSGGIKGYTLDTGQSRQTVTRSDMGELRGTLASLENTRTMLRARLGCGGQLYARPGF